MAIHYKDFETAVDLADQAAKDISGILHTTVSDYGRATLVGAGGSTPKAIYDRLAKKFIPWERIHVTLGDERWVDLDHPLSNEAMLKSHLLKGEAAKAHIVGLKTPHDTPYDGRPQVEARLRDMKPPFDVVMLGMGLDGHTASLFPGDPFLALALDLDNSARCAAIQPDPMPADAPVLRMTLTASALTDARHVMLFVQGKDKLAVLDEALQGDDALAMPIRAILHQKHVDVTVYRAK